MSCNESPARFAKRYGLHGITLSSIGMDDVTGECGQGPYPLLHAVADVFDLYINKSSGISITKTYYSSIPFTLDKIDVRLCTHLLINCNSSLLSSSISDKLKKINSNLKILLKIQLNDDDININQLKIDINDKKVDGINININSKTFSNNITEIIKTIRKSWSNKYLLTISFQVPTDSTDQTSFLQMIELHKYFDLLILLPFDKKSIENYNNIQPWNSLSSFIPVNPTKNIGDFSMISILHFVLSTGLPKEKLIMSIPTYGLAFKLEDENKYQIGDHIAKKDFSDRIIHKVGILSYHKICHRIQSHHYKRIFNSQSILVTAHSEKNFIIFDDIEPIMLNNNISINGTIELKAKFIKNSQLAGVLIDSIDMDDYTGVFCHNGVFPITSTIFRVFFNETTSKSSINICANVKTLEILPDENDSRYYYVCQPNSDKPYAHLMCPLNMYFQDKYCVEELS
ncbi:unnamed protein product, partial [Rotaria sp. Silwood1]